MKKEGGQGSMFSKDHFYTGKLGISTYAWGDPRWGFFYGDVRMLVEDGLRRR